MPPLEEITQALRSRGGMAAAAVVAGLIVFAVWNSSEQPTPVSAPIVSGERFTIASRSVPDLKPVAATVTTRDMSEARARISGTLVQLAVREGDEVKQGQLIAVVSDQRLTYETKAVDAQVAAANAEATRARAELERVRSLYQSGVYAKARLDQAEAAAQSAEGALNAAKAQRAASAEVGAQGAILAPKAGRVLRADVPAGSVVMAGQSVATITAGDPLLRLEIPEVQARALKVGESVPVVAQDLPGIGPAGTIVQIYPAIVSGRVTADLSVPGLRAELIGQRARVNVKVGEREALIVPSRFIQTRHGIDFVRLLGADAPTDIPVQVASGPIADEKEILAGLNVGDVILLPEGPSS